MPPIVTDVTRAAAGGVGVVGEVGAETTVVFVPS
jgi:hypothetical protein